MPLCPYWNFLEVSSWRRGEGLRKVTELINEIDIAVEAWHEDGRWSVANLPDAQDIPAIIDRLKAQQTNGGA